MGAALVEGSAGPLVRASYFDDIFRNDMLGPESASFPSYVVLILKDLNTTSSQLRPSNVAKNQSLPTIKSVTTEEDAAENR